MFSPLSPWDHTPDTRIFTPFAVPVVDIPWSLSATVDSGAAHSIDSVNAETAHQRAVENGQDHYFDPATGLLVMTALHHRRRGYCCENSCRHCPYGEASTPEP